MNLARRTLVIAASAALAAGTFVTAPAASATASGCGAGAVTSYTPPEGTDGAFGVTQGPGGTWYAHGATINRIQNGTTTQYALPDPADADAGWLTWDSTSSVVWFADRGTGRLGTIDIRGRVREFQIPDGVNGPAVPQGIVIGPDGALWFTELRAGNIGRITTSGELTEIPVDGGPVGITMGPDGHLYTAMYLSSQLAQLDSLGHVARTWDVPGALQVAASQGRLWVTYPFVDSVSRVAVQCPD